MFVPEVFHPTFLPRLFALILCRVTLGNVNYCDVEEFCRIFQVSNNQTICFVDVLALGHADALSLHGGQVGRLFFRRAGPNCYPRVSPQLLQS